MTFQLVFGKFLELADPHIGKALETSDNNMSLSSQSIPLNHTNTNLMQECAWYFRLHTAIA